MTADPSALNNSVENSQSWNRYAYTNGDPINGNDPRGLNLAELVCGGGNDWAASGFAASGIGGGYGCGGGGGWALGGDIWGGGGQFGNCFADAASSFLSSSCTGPAGPPLPLPPPPLAPEDPSCEINFQYRGLDFPLAPTVGLHGYLSFTTSFGTSEVFEGYTDESNRLKAWGRPGGLDANKPSTDKSAGRVSGEFVCDWFASLNSSVSRINRANIDYNDLGPNSSSALRYMLSQLPETFTAWFSVPFTLVGFDTKLPGLEK